MTNKAYYRSDYPTKLPWYILYCSKDALICCPIYASCLIRKPNLFAIAEWVR